MIDLPPPNALVANTPRLRLVPLRVADVEEMFTLLNDQRLHRYVGGLPLGEAELKERYRAEMTRRSADGSDVRLTWVIRLVPLGEAIGEVRATVTEVGTATVSYLVGTRWQRHGFCTEAVFAMARLLDAHFAVDQLVAAVPASHRAAQKVAARLGMTRGEQRSPDGWPLWTGSNAVAVDLALSVLPPPPRRRRRGVRAAVEAASAARPPASRRRRPAAT